MFLKQIPVVHPVKLVAGEDQLIVILAHGEPVQVLADGVGSSLKPMRICHGLLGGQNLDEAFCKGIESIAVDDVVIQGGRIELSQYENFVQSGVDAIADGNVDQPIFSAQWNRRFGSVLGQREETLSRSAGEDNR
jgi:hypothetical protein